MYYLITKSYEYSSDRIMDWFYFLNQHVVRFNTDDFRGTKINISNKELDNKFLIRKISYLESNSNKNIEQNIFNSYKTLTPQETY